MNDTFVRWLWLWTMATLLFVGWWRGEDWLILLALCGAVGFGVGANVRRN